MSGAESSTVLRNLQAVFENGPVAGLTDAQLLERFVSRHDDGTGFEALVARHGPMVLGVCRDILRDDHAAEDAFQATFLILVRKARSVRVGDSLGRWLYGVAWKVARRARSDAARRARREAPIGEWEDAPDSDQAADVADLKAALHEELAQLSETQRTPIVLCHLQGLTHDEAARRLGWPVGTVRSRLARGRDRLRSRLARRGLAPAAGVAALASQSPAAVPPRLMTLTIRAAFNDAAGQTGAIGAAVLKLVQGVIASMFLTKLKLAAATVLLGALLVVGGTVVQAWQDPPQADEPAPRSAPGNDRSAGESQPPQVRATRSSPEDPFSARREHGGFTPSELAARLKYARDRSAFLKILVERGTLPTRDLLDSRAEVEILEGQIAGMIDQLEEDLELLKNRLEIKRTESAQVLARRAATQEELKVEQSHLGRGALKPEDRMRTAGRLLTIEKQIKEYEFEYKIKQAEMKEVEILINHAGRRLERLRPLLSSSNQEPRPSEGKAP